MIVADQWHVICTGRPHGWQKDLDWLLDREGMGWLPQNGVYPGSRYPPGAWPLAHAKVLLSAKRGFEPLIGDRRLKARLERACCCQCCGKNSYQERITLALGHTDPSRRLWRCERHWGRLPCIIEGCGRTYAIDGPTGSNSHKYRSIIMCGKHWRQAPKYMRDTEARVRRIAKKRGWTDDLLIRHHRIWERCHRAIREGQNIDMRQIEEMFGLDG